MNQEYPFDETRGYDRGADNEEYQPLPSDVKNWAMLCHLSALAGLAVPGLAMWVGPLVIWLLKREDHPFIDEQGKESLNFQMSMLIYLVAGTAIGLLTTCVGVGFGVLALVMVLPVINSVFVIIAAMKANSGIDYRYPLTIRLLK